MSRRFPHHPKRYNNTPHNGMLDRLIYVMAFLTPVFEIPQAYKIYHDQSAANVSVATWGFFMFASIVWLAYAIKYKLKPLIICYSLYLIVESIIVVGIIIYH